MKLVANCAGVIGVFLLVVGCGKEPAATPPPAGLVTQGASTEAANTYADANLAELTRELRRWIVATKQRPANFEEFATSAKVKVPPPPPGKKYALSSEMRVVFVDR